MRPVRLVDSTVEEIRSERVRINLQWLVKLRWAAILGQLLTIGVVTSVMDVAVPLAPLLVLVGTIAASNLGLALTTGRRAESRDAGHRRPDPHAATLVGGVMVVDILILAGLLYFTGGSTNPFVIFFLVHVVLGAVFLPSRWALALVVLTVSCFGVLFGNHRPLEVLETDSVRRWGFFVAFVVASAVSVSFVLRVRRVLEKREQDLRRARRRKERLDRVEALVTLAAGAAHELATPLSTIAVVAKELERDVEAIRPAPADGDEIADDVRLIRREVSRCRNILDQMSGRAGETAGELVEWTSIADILDDVVVALPESSRERVRVRIAGDVGTRRVFAPRQALARVLRSLVKNGLDASAATEPVVVHVDAAADEFRLVITDLGSGMTDEILEQSFEPFFTTKEAGRGMGLGLFLARSVIERLGGTLALHSKPGEGTRATAVIPRDGQLTEPVEPEGAKRDGE